MNETTTKARTRYAYSRRLFELYYAEGKRKVCGWSCRLVVGSLRLGPVRILLNFDGQITKGIENLEQGEEAGKETLWDLKGLTSKPMLAGIEMGKIWHDYKGKIDPIYSTSLSTS